jgi:2-oxoglutarate dehydrogenase E2 component (dihydrolipoamide succinyltransferase)
MTDVRMPELGETITQGTITRWFKEVGDTVAVEEALFEVSTDKVDAEVPSPIAGTITKILIALGETVDVGTVVAEVDAVGSVPATAAAPPAAQSAPAAPGGAATPPPAAPALQPAPEALAEVAPPASPVEARVAPAAPELLVTSPIVRKLINDLGTDASLVTGTGPDGRVTRQDAEKVAFSPDHLNAASVARAPQSAPSRLVPPPMPPDANFVPFNKTRKITGDRMVISKATSPHVMTAIEVDYERIESVRHKNQAQWRRAEGFTLTYLPFICRALVQALHEFPHLNASVVEGGLVLHEHVDLNIAIDLNFEGLLAPVVRRAEDKRLGAIAREIADLAARARSSKLRTEELIGGTFTISNSGPFGTFMVAPVINQPQVAILSTDGVSRKPVVITDNEGGESIAIHSVGMLVLSWDHRAFDGAYAAAFLRSLKDVLENNAWDSEL